MPVVARGDVARDLPVVDTRDHDDRITLDRRLHLDEQRVDALLEPRDDAPASDHVAADELEDHAPRSTCKRIRLPDRS